MGQAANYLKTDGLMVVEVGHGQASAVMAMAREAFSTAEVSYDKDLVGIPRVVGVRRPKIGELLYSRV